MWPFKRTKYEGTSWSTTGIESCLSKLNSKHVFLRDKDYVGISTKLFEKIIFDSWFPLDYKGYTPEIWDCDNFAVAFMAAVSHRWAKVSRVNRALAFGYIEANVEGMGWHAFIWHMDDKGIIRFYEPQTGRQVCYNIISVRLVEA